ncbi:hypothetical protein CCACVL1_06125, partial [Corchorus capsularis]
GQCRRNVSQPQDPHVPPADQGQAGVTPKFFDSAQAYTNWWNSIGVQTRPPQLGFASPPMAQGQNPNLPPPMYIPLQLVYIFPPVMDHTASSSTACLIAKKVKEAKDLGCKIFEGSDDVDKAKD